MRGIYLEKADVNFAGGVYSFPALSTGFKMSNRATIFAIASQMLASARACPGQDLICAALTRKDMVG